MRKSYIIITKTCGYAHAEDLTIDYLIACEEGLLSVIDISDPTKPLHLVDGEWLLLDAE